jgi:UDP-glucose:(heptosyl)LPS alpha-1,3-glucosyltransferase
MAAYYHAADVCVHPTYYDPCSRVVLEALAQGVPCITTAFNGASEVMTDGREGLHHRDAGRGGRAGRTVKDLSSCDLRRRMGESALSLRERVSMARHVKELNEVFVELAAQKQGCCQPA